VAVRDLVLEIAQAVTVPSRLRRMLMLEGFFESMPVVRGGRAVGALRPVGHDDVRVTVRIFTVRPMRVLDHLHEPVGMRIRAEIMPVDVRTSGFALAYSLATAIFGGFTPALSTYLIHISGNRAIPGLWLSFAAACGLVATIFAKPRSAQVEAQQTLTLQA